MFAIILCCIICQIISITLLTFLGYKSSFQTKASEALDECRALSSKLSNIAEHLTGQKTEKFCPFYK